MFSTTKSDVIVIGGGPCGSTAATFLAKAGKSVRLFERETFPRFHIGESLLPASMPIFKETGFYEVLNRGKYLQKFGARFVDYKTEDQIYFGFQDGLNAEIPSAFEVERADFDQDILNFAKTCGVEVHQPERVRQIDFTSEQVQVITGEDQYSASYLIDCTGRDSFVGKRLGRRVSHKDLNNVAVFSHYHGIQRYEGPSEGDITIGLLPGGAWTWMIPFQGDRTSVGVVCSSKIFQPEKGLLEFLEGTLCRSPTVQGLMTSAERATEVTSIANYSHHSEHFFGPRVLLAGDAAVFLDPIFSSGVHVGVTSGKLAAQTILKAFDQSLTLELGALGERYQFDFMKGVNRFHKLIAMFYEGNFVSQMKKTLQRESMRKAFTSAVAGDVWNDENFLFSKGIL